MRRFWPAGVVMEPPPFPSPKRPARKTRWLIVGLVGIGFAALVWASGLFRAHSSVRRPTSGIEFVLAAYSGHDPASQEHAHRLKVTMEVLRYRLLDQGIDFAIDSDKEGRLLVKVPLLDESRLKEIRSELTRNGFIEFRRVYSDTSYGDDASSEGPPGYERMVLTTEHNGREVTEDLWVKRVPDLTGQVIERAKVVAGLAGRFSVNLSFTADGRERFSDVTRRLAAEKDPLTHAASRLAIVLDDELISAPAVREEITGGNAEITGSFTRREAMQLATVLNDPLQVRLRIVDERTFGQEPRDN